MACGGALIPGARASAARGQVVRVPTPAVATVRACPAAPDALYRNGQRVRCLGADTPLADLTGLAAQLRPDLVVLTTTIPHGLDGRTDDIARLAPDTMSVHDRLVARRAVGGWPRCATCTATSTPDSPTATASGCPRTASLT